MYHMNKHRRSRIELCIDVLRAIYDGRRSPSHVVYAANLSYDRVTRYINYLEDKGLVQRITDKRKMYEITERGREVIHQFDDVEASLFYTKRLNIHIV